MHQSTSICTLTLSLMLVGLAISTPSVAITHEQLQLPNCLAVHLNDFAVIAKNQDFSIIDVPKAQVDLIAHLADRVHCGHFINVSHVLKGTSLTSTNAADQLLNHRTKKVSFRLIENYKIEHQMLVKQHLKQIAVANIEQTLVDLDQFPNRSATKTTGRDVAYWLKSLVDKLAVKYRRKDVATYFVDTGDDDYYQQPSLVMVIGNNINAPAIVIGAHMDTLDDDMPGADDDGSGIASTLEMARIMLSSTSPLKRPIYFVWYAAEERGLVGSQYVVKHFRQQSIAVKASMQFDMTGYRFDSNNPTMWVYRDYTSNQLSDFSKKLIEAYIGVTVGESTCGYGCSDHASWTLAGIPAAFTCESDFDHHNPYIHTAEDTRDKLTLEHIHNFTKLGLAFAIELACK